MKVLVTGASGQLGYDVCRELAERGIEAVGQSSETMDITDAVQVRRGFAECEPDAVIHCAAYTKVDQAEDEPERCWAVNAAGTQNIALACREADAKLIYISTDYIFPGDGNRFYEVTDAVDPRNIYGLSKLAGELAVKALTEKHYIVRASWAFGVHGNNFVRAILRKAQSGEELSVVCDQIGSPTYTLDLAQLLCDMVQTDKYGTYHASNEGTCSWAEFAEEILRLTGRENSVRHVPAEMYAARARRPKNSRLSKDRLSEAGFARLPSWQDGLKRYLLETGELKL